MISLRVFWIVYLVHLTIYAEPMAFRDLRSKPLRQRKINKKPSFAKDLGYTISGIACLALSYLLFNQSIQNQNEYAALAQQNIAEPSPASESKNLLHKFGSYMFAIKKGPASTPYSRERAMVEKDERLLDLYTSLCVNRGLSLISLGLGFYLVAKGMHYIK